VQDGESPPKCDTRCVAKHQRDPRSEDSQVDFSTPSLRASYGNAGTAVDPAELPWSATAGRVMRQPKLHLEADPRGEMTCYGGLVLAQQCVRRCDHSLPQSIGDDAWSSCASAPSEPRPRRTAGQRATSCAADLRR
jgi:hypothetical protein